MAGIARWCYRHRFIVLALWLVALAGVTVVNKSVGTGYSDNFALPGTESTRALHLLQSAFPQQAGESDTVVWHVTNGSVRDPAVQQPVTAMLARLSNAPQVAQVVSPYSAQGAAQISRDGRTAYATLHLTTIGRRVPRADVRNIIDIAQSVRTPNLEVELGGNAIQQANQVAIGITEVVDVAAA